MAVIFLNEKYPPPKVANYHQQNVVCKKGLIVTDTSHLGFLFAVTFHFNILIYIWTRLENKNSTNWNEMLQLFRSDVAWGFRFWGGESYFVLGFFWKKDVSNLICKITWFWLFFLSYEILPRWEIMVSSVLDPSARNTISKGITTREHFLLLK